MTDIEITIIRAWYKLPSTCSDEWIVENLSDSLGLAMIRVQQAKVHFQLMLEKQMKDRYGEKIDSYREFMANLIVSMKRMNNSPISGSNNDKFNY